MAKLRRTDFRTLLTSSTAHTSTAPASSAAIHISSSGMRWVQTMGKAGKSRCRFSTSASREDSMSKTTAPGRLQHLPACRRLFRQRFKRFSLELSVFLQQDLHLAFRLFQLLAARRGELHAFFKESERFFQRNLSLFQFLNNLLKSLEALFKLGQR